MSRRPTIGVSVSTTGGRLLWWCNWLAVMFSGGRPVRLRPGNRKLWSELDGLVLGGGDDIGAEIYGGQVTPDIRIDPQRDRMELDLLQHAEKHRLPVLGICRGAQMMNVFRGGNLHTDIQKAFDGSDSRRSVLPRKTVSIDPESRLYAIVRAQVLKVNSLHHQAVDRLGSALRSVAFEDSGIVQAVENIGPRFFTGVQWHPELLIYRGRQIGLFRALVESARSA